MNQGRKDSKGCSSKKCGRGRSAIINLKRPRGVPKKTESDPGGQKNYKSFIFMFKKIKSKRGKIGSETGGSPQPPTAPFLYWNSPNMLTGFLVFFVFSQTGSDGIEFGCLIILLFLGVTALSFPICFTFYKNKQSIS